MRQAVRRADRRVATPKATPGGGTDLRTKTPPKGRKHACRTRACAHMIRSAAQAPIAPRRIGKTAAAASPTTAPSRIIRPRWPAAEATPASAPRSARRWRPPCPTCPPIASPARPSAWRGCGDTDAEAVAAGVTGALPRRRRPRHGIERARGVGASRPGSACPGVATGPLQGVSVGRGARGGETCEVPEKTATAITPQDNRGLPARSGRDCRSGLACLPVRAAAPAGKGSGVTDRTALRSCRLDSSSTR